MKNLNIPSEIKRVDTEILNLDMEILDAARKEVKRKCNNKDTAARIVGIAIGGTLMVALLLSAASIGVVGSIVGILASLGLAKKASSVISEVTSDSVKKKCDDIPALRKLAEKMAEKNPELAAKLESKEENQQILDYLNEQLNKKERGQKVEFTPIEKVAPGELRGPQELVDVLTRVLEKKKNQA